MRILKKWLVLLTLLIMIPSFAEEIEDGRMIGPPADLPLKIQTRFFLLNLLSVDEKNEIFKADVYFTFNWKDPRLAYTATKENDFKIYLEEAVANKLQKIWRPQVEFVNAEYITYTNRSLLIFPDGSVEYHIGLNAQFYSPFNLKKFPFDTQNLQIKVDSFMWNKNVLLFVPATVGDLYEPGRELHREDKILEVKESSTFITGLKVTHFGGVNEFSSYVVDIKIKRTPTYFVYQVFIPLFLLVGISCAVFFGYKEPFLDKVMINLTAFLVVLAAKFVVNQDLPQIGYMTLVDEAFFLAYLCIGLSVVVDVLQKMWSGKREHWVLNLHKYARWSIFGFFTICLIVIFLYGTFSN